MNTIYAILSLVAFIVIFIFAILGKKKYKKQIAKKCDPVLAQLQANDDKNSMERCVDHWIYFNTKTDSDNFIADVNKLGFKLLSEQTKEADIYNFVINIGRNDNVTRNNIIKIVSKLEQIAKKHDGYYDGWGCPIVK